MAKWGWVSALALVLWVGAASASPFGDGEQAYRDGDYPRALQLMLPIAEGGNAEAQLIVGQVYQSGRDVPRNYAEAARFLRLSAAQGNINATVSLGTLAERGLGVAHDYSEAMRLYRQAADRGDALARNNIGHLYIEGLGVPRDPAEALKWFTLAANQSNPVAQNNLGVMYLKGDGVAIDLAKANALFHQAAMQNNADGQVNLGSSYAFGRGVPKDETEALKWLRMAAAQGNSTAVALVAGLEHADAENFAAAGASARSGDFVTMIRLIQPLADKGYAPALGALGFAYLTGQGVPIDDGKALALFRAAADQGNSVGYLGLGHVYAFGYGAPRNDAEALKWLRRAADAGIAEAKPMIAETEKRSAAMSDQKPLSCAGFNQLEISAPPARLFMVGFSFVPPAGAKWCVNSATPKGTEFHIDYLANAGRMPNEISLPEYAHTFFMIVTRADVEHGVPQTPSELLVFANKWAAAGGPEGKRLFGKQVLSLKVIKEDSRFTTTHWSAEAETAFGLDCVRVEISMDERENTHYPGVQILEVADHLCLNPATGNDLIRISVSERYMQGRRGGTSLMLIPEVYDFLRSFRLQAPPDDGNAINRFRETAERGRAQAQFALATYYDQRGKDQLALTWYRRAAEQHHADAEYIVGTIYEEGRGVVADPGEALKWFHLAADAGIAEAHAALARQYELGHGTAVNLVLAYAHLTVAATKLPAGEGRDGALANRVRVAKALSADQITSAERLAGEWRPGDL